MPELLETPNPIQTVKQEEMATFAAVAKHLAPLGVGLHCSRCGQDLHGTNAEQDHAFSVQCGCREFKATNPHQRKLYFTD